MRRVKQHIFSLLLLCCSSISVRANILPSHVGMDAAATTLGAQLGVASAWGDHVALQLSGAMLPLAVAPVIDNVKFDAKARFRSAQLRLSLYPFTRFMRHFHLDGGAVWNDNRLTVNPRLQGQHFSFQGYDFVLPDDAQFTTKVRFNALNPYLGIGWGLANSKGFGVQMNAGVIYQGQPQVSYDVSAGVRLAAGQQQDLNQAIADAESKISDHIKHYAGWMAWYPVATLGLSYTF